MERAKIGRLEEQRVSPGTLACYDASLRDLASFTRLGVGELLSHPDLEQILCTYIEHLWEDGDPKTVASYTVAAAQFHNAKLKHQIPRAWKLLSLWNKLEQPIRATPMSPSLLLAFAGVLMSWRWKRLAYLCIVGYCGLLRTGEMFLIRKRDVILSSRNGPSAVVFLQDTKTAQRNHLLWEKVVISEKLGIHCLKLLCRDLKADDYLVDETAAKLRDLWKQVIAYLKLERFNFLPYSIRRGAATSCYVNGSTFDELLEKGRWKHIATARLYIDQAAQEYTQLTLPRGSLPLIRAAQAWLQLPGWDAWKDP